MRTASKIPGPGHYDVGSTLKSSGGGFQTGSRELGTAMQLAMKSSEGKPGPKYLLRSSVNEVSGGVISEAKPKTGLLVFLLAALPISATAPYMGYPGRSILTRVSLGVFQTWNGKCTAQSKYRAREPTIWMRTKKSVAVSFPLQCQILM